MDGHDGPVQEGVAGALWKEQALQRSLGAARAHSEAQSHRLVEAARELTAEIGPTFTVQQVATKAGFSLKTLYRSFAGKDELLLAVFEEDNRLAVEVLTPAIEVHQTFPARLRAFVTGLFDLAMSRNGSNYAALVMREYFRLAQEHAEQVEHVLSPYVELLVNELERVAAQGVALPDDPRRAATAVFLLVVSQLCPLVLADKEADAAATAEFVSSFSLRALGVTS
jgi:AcrR family transcriptional regulator